MTRTATGLQVASVFLSILCAVVARVQSLEDPTRHRALKSSKSSKSSSSGMSSSSRSKGSSSSSDSLFRSDETVIPPPSPTSITTITFPPVPVPPPTSDESGTLPPITTIPLVTSTPTEMNPTESTMTPTESTQEEGEECLDLCISEILQDGECINDIVSDPVKGCDTYDCDICQEFNLDCEFCVRNGCSFCPTDGHCLSASNTNCSHAKSSCPSESAWTTTCEPLPQSVFSDPLYSAMEWSYNLLNVQPVWQEGVTGAGVRVRVNDPVGVDLGNPEFTGRIDLNASCENYAPNVFEPNEDFEIAEENHGTAVASIAVGGADNGVCAVGIAPGATLSGCIVPLYPVDYAAMYLGEIGVVDISVNSWGEDACNFYRRRKLFQGDCPFDADHRDSPCNDEACLSSPDSVECKNTIAYYCGTQYDRDPIACLEYLDVFVSCGYNVIGEDLQAAFAQGIIEGRDGKGILYVFATGNSFQLGVDVNMEGLMNTRFTIIVGGVDRAGKHSSFSATGAALVVSGPAGDDDTNVSNNIVATASAYGGGCSDATVGNSFSCPAVAGAIALMLEVNPELGWRDVIAILASTAQKTDPENTSWSQNAAGLWHSPLFGFGLVDASAAVTSARTWQNYPAEQQIMVASGDVSIPIVDDATVTTTSTIMVPMQGTEFMAEHVVVYLRLEYPNRGDLEVTLTAPSNTESVLHPSPRPEASPWSTDQTWKLMTVRNWSEDPVGNWTISIVDKAVGNKPLGDCVDQPFEGSFEGGDGEVNFVDCFGFEILGWCSGGFVQRPNAVLQIVDVNSTLRADDQCCACGGGAPAEVGTCYDNDLVLEVEADEEVVYVDCGFIEDAGICVDGVVLNSTASFPDEFGTTPEKACCSCGGGSTITDLNSLLSWELVVYGHNL